MNGEYSSASAATSTATASIDVPSLATWTGASVVSASSWRSRWISSLVLLYATRSCRPGLVVNAKMCPAVTWAGAITPIEMSMSSSNVPVILTGGTTGSSPPLPLNRQFGTSQEPSVTSASSLVPNTSAATNWPASRGPVRKQTTASSYSSPISIAYVVVFDVASNWPASFFHAPPFTFSLTSTWVPGIARSIVRASV